MKEFVRKIAGLFRAQGRDVSLGRNEPCWCGSGRKYKRCHLDGDREQVRARGSNCAKA